MVKDFCSYYQDLIELKKRYDKLPYCASDEEKRDLMLSTYCLIKAFQKQNKNICDLPSGCCIDFGDKNFSENYFPFYKRTLNEILERIGMLN